jgi:hypothetical protein
MFRRDAFLPGATDPRPFHLRALEQGHFWEEKVARDLSELVFERVFPDLARGLAGNDPDAPSILSAKYLEEVRNGALILLYRLLFVLYAEDRNLLPVSDRRYEDYGLRAKVREDVHARIDKGDAFSSTAGNYYGHMKGLFRAIAKGDAALGLPPYNGGLFEPSAAPILVRAELPDSVIAPVIHALSRRKEEGRKVYINYRDLSVQQLGSIYERLLEFQLRADGGAIIVWPNVFARRGSGSYYTPDELVSLIINRTIGPLIDERLRAFERQANRLARASHSIAARLQDLAKFDPASAILDLKICDPAMGSGHFLVSLVDYLADRILATIAESESKEAVEWGDYVSPLGARILAIRSQIEKHAEEEKWVIEDGQLDDRHILRRMILKRVIHGVDKNPMAVELAKVALWLHTFTVGAPLSFLDHHLKCGDSLFGEWVRPVMDKIVKWGGELLINNALQRAQGSARGMSAIENLTDAEIAEARQSASLFSEVAKVTAPLASFMSLIHALEWLSLGDKDDKAAVRAWLDGVFGDPVAVATGDQTVTRPPAEQTSFLAPAMPNKQKSLLGVVPRTDRDRETASRFAALLSRAKTLIVEENFFHWQVAFPGVWTAWENVERVGGFDAVIGNPPWDRIKLQEVEWFAARKPDIAKAETGAKRKTLIEALEKAKDPLFKDYERATARAADGLRMARTCGEFPLLSAGDVNIYSLFVEKAFRLAKADGMVGLLTPSGIASDKTAAPFFQSIAITGRLAGLFDFEN